MRRDKTSHEGGDQHRQSCPDTCTKRNSLRRLRFMQIHCPGADGQPQQSQDHLYRDADDESGEHGTPSYARLADIPFTYCSCDFHMAP